MPTPSLSRRRFLQTTLAAGTAFTVAPTFGAFSSNPSKSVRLGAPVFGAPADPDGLAKAHRDLGYRAAYCPNIDLADKERIRDTEAAFEKHDVVIAEVGRWVNLMDSDPEKRKQNHAFVTEGLALAEAVGARCCVDIAGSFNEEVWYGPHPKNFSQEFFDAAVENARKIIDAVKPKRTKFAYEMMGWARPDSADSYLALLKAIDRPGFAVHLDPCNAINCNDRLFEN
jgi:sugar phosphate isomerase/epimerase